jgi:hypothetical protein
MVPEASLRLGLVENLDAGLRYTASSLVAPSPLAI